MNALELMAAISQSVVCTVSDTPVGVRCSICSTMLTLDAPATVDELNRVIAEHAAGEHAS